MTNVKETVTARAQKSVVEHSVHVSVLSLRVCETCDRKIVLRVTTLVLLQEFVVVSYALEVPFAITGLQNLSVYQ
jgi:hypothetical protein